MSASVVATTPTAASAPAADPPSLSPSPSPSASPPPAVADPLSLLRPPPAALHRAPLTVLVGCAQSRRLIHAAPDPIPDPDPDRAPTANHSASASAPASASGAGVVVPALARLPGLPALHADAASVAPHLPHPPHWRHVALALTVRDLAPALAALPPRAARRATLFLLLRAPAPLPARPSPPRSAAGAAAAAATLRARVVLRLVALRIAPHGCVLASAEAAAEAPLPVAPSPASQTDKAAPKAQLAPPRARAALDAILRVYAQPTLDADTARPLAAAAAPQSPSRRRKRANHDHTNDDSKNDNNANNANNNDDAHISSRSGDNHESADGADSDTTESGSEADEDDDQERDRACFGAEYAAISAAIGDASWSDDTADLVLPPHWDSREKVRAVADARGLDFSALVSEAESIVGQVRALRARQRATDDSGRQPQQLRPTGPSGNSNSSPAVAARLAAHDAWLQRMAKFKPPVKNASAPKLQQQQVAQQQTEQQNAGVGSNADFFQRLLSNKR